MFIGENLTNLRIMHGFSRKQLSEKIGVTEQAVWQYENGYTSPKLQIVNELKDIFKVKSRYFYTKDILKQYTLPSNINLMNIAYRSKVINVISKTQAEAKHVEYLDAFINYISAKITVPTLAIVKLREEVLLFLHTSDEDRQEQIRHVAHLARERLNLSQSDNDDLMYLVEKSGVFIFEKAMGDEIDAYSLWTQNDRAYIILGNTKHSTVRRNFDIAHELGHLLLHYRLEFSSLDRKDHKIIENEANIFASAFLLPENEFKQDMKEFSYITNPDSYLDLKKKWKTSLQVLAYRAASLDIINSKEHRNFYAAMQRKKYLEKEPLDDVIPVQKPMKIRTIIDFSSKKGLIDVKKMIENDWNVEPSFFHNMTGIPLGFLMKYTVKEFDFALGNVALLSERDLK